MNIIKAVIVLAVICLVSLWSRAENPHHRHPDPIPGPAGPKGDRGDPGQSIVGPSGSDSKQDRLNAYLGAGVRLYDAKHWSAQTYLNQDVWHGGTVVGGQILFKLGKSYEEREIEALRAELKDARALMAMVANPPEAEKPVRARIRGSR